MHINYISKGETFVYRFDRVISVGLLVYDVDFDRCGNRI